MSTDGEFHQPLQQLADAKHPHCCSSDGYKIKDPSRPGGLRERRPEHYNDRSDRLQRVRVQSSWRSRQTLQLLARQDAFAMWITVLHPELIPAMPRRQVSPKAKPNCDHFSQVNKGSFAPFHRIVGLAN